MISQRVIALILAGIFALPELFSSAQAEIIQPQKDDIETERVLQNALEKAGISSRIILEDNKNFQNHVLEVRFGENTTANIPAMILLIDAVATNRDKKTEFTNGQLIRITSTLNHQLSEKNRNGALEFSNAWNSKLTPVRLFFSPHRIYAMQVIPNSRKHPLDTEQFLSLFSGHVRIWEIITREMRRNNFLK